MHIGLLKNPRCLEQETVKELLAGVFAVRDFIGSEGIRRKMCLPEQSFQSPRELRCQHPRSDEAGGLLLEIMVLYPSTLGIAHETRPPSLQHPSRKSFYSSEIIILPRATNAILVHNSSDLDIEYLAIG